jgi:serine/threonine-protein kinase
MVMQLLDGHTLADVLRGGPLPTRRVIADMIQMARGIARAHDLGVVHRDLKPDNVFVCRRADGMDLVKILDFGIARSRDDPRLTAVGELFGTPQYMAPERVISGEAGPSVDLYALGVIFYEAVTGKLPFEAPDATSFLVKHMKERPRAPRAVDPGVPPKLDALVMQLLEKDPRARPVDAHRVELDLLALASTLNVPVPPEPDKDPESVASGVVSSPPAGAELAGEWAARLDVFREMLARSQTARMQDAIGVPPYGTADLEATLVEMDALFGELAADRRSSARDQSALEEVDARGREGRMRFGVAVDALGLDASRARDELRAARIDVDRLGHQTKRAAAAYEAALHELMTWEGRSGMVEPYPQLAESHRQCAKAVDAWASGRRAERSAQAMMNEKSVLAGDLDYQIAELRSALSAHTQAVEAEHDATRERLLESNARAEEVEARLLALAARFCEPLRARPDLGPLFRRLEGGASMTGGDAAG